MTTLGLVSRRRIHGLRGSRGAAAASLAAVATLGATAVGQAAQVPSGAVAASPKPPAYRPLRQDENWHALAGTSRTGIDTVKYMPLREDEAIWLSLGGEARLRGELWDGFRFGNPPTAAADDTFLLSRLRLHGDLHVGPSRHTHPTPEVVAEHAGKEQQDETDRHGEHAASRRESRQHE